MRLAHAPALARCKYGSTPLGSTRWIGKFAKDTPSRCSACRSWSPPPAPAGRLPKANAQRCNRRKHTLRPQHRQRARGPSLRTHRSPPAPAPAWRLLEPNPGRCSRRYRGLRSPNRRRTCHAAQRSHRRTPSEPVAPINHAVEPTAPILFAWLGHRQANGFGHACNENALKPRLTMTVAARAVGGPARRPETTPANKKWNDEYVNTLE